MAPLIGIATICVVVLLSFCQEVSHQGGRPFTTKRIYKVTTNPMTKSQAEAACSNNDNGSLTNLALPSTLSLLNIMLPYIKTGIVSKTYLYWTGITRNSSIYPTQWLYNGTPLDSTILEYFPVEEFQFMASFDCIAIKYSQLQDAWILRPTDCDTLQICLCEIHTDELCEYTGMGNVHIEPPTNTSISSSFFFEISIETCKEICQSWVRNNTNACWFISFNPATYECEIMENDVMPSKYESCDWHVKDDLWVTERRVCYELTVYDINGTLLRYPPCNLPATNLNEIESSTDSEKLSTIESSTDSEKLSTIESSTDSKKLSTIESSTDSEKLSTIESSTDSEKLSTIESSTDSEKLSTIESSPDSKKLSTIESSTVSEKLSTGTHRPTNNCVKRCWCQSNRDEVITEILDLLKMDEKNTSSYRRLFTSAPDDRPLSVGLGWTGIALLILVGAGILALDSGRLYQDVKTLWENTKHAFGTPERDD